MRRSIATVQVANSSELVDVCDYVVPAMEDVNPLTSHRAGVAKGGDLEHKRRQRVSALLRRTAEKVMSANWVEF